MFKTEHLLKTHQKRLSEAFKTASYHKIGLYLQSIGLDYAELKDYDNAVEFLLRSIPYLRNVKDNNSLLKTLSSIDLYIPRVSPKRINNIFNEVISTDLGRTYYEDVFKKQNIIDPETLRKEAEKYLRIAKSNSVSQKAKPYSIALNYYNSAMCLMFSGDKEEKVSELFQKAYDYILDDPDFDEFLGVTMAKCCERTDFGLESTETYINDNLEIIDNKIKKLKSDWEDPDVKILTFLRMEYDSILSRVRAKINLEKRDLKRAKAEVENSILGFKEILFMSSRKDILKLELKDAQNIREKIMSASEKKRIRLPFVYYPN